MRMAAVTPCQTFGDAGHRSRHRATTQAVSVKRAMPAIGASSIVTTAESRRGSL